MASRRSKTERTRHGYCKLTGKPGRFVKSHIIPQALTKISEQGGPFFQYGEGTRPTQRCSSWYDQGLVIREGEDILSEIDTRAIEALREHRLVWSSWGEATTLGSLHDVIQDPFGFRQVHMDTKMLRIFFLSLLWRAAESQLSEFKEIALPAADAEVIRKALVDGLEPPMSFYPIQLTQLSTLGPVHNHAPRRDVKYLPCTDDVERPIDMYRFYFDGLIAHIMLPTLDSVEIGDLGALVLGGESSVVSSTVTFEKSAQRRDIAAILREYDLHEDFLRR
ncbi:hypothetical protein C1931_17725 [Stenotrophomonas sp. YAU14A_MKIMI4_1]|nr:hypothetical protein C1931_17725 [Stenotrophomonas sp. YAU14A_MKIMI4_1]